MSAQRMSSALDSQGEVDMTDSPAPAPAPVASAPVGAAVPVVPPMPQAEAVVMPSGPQYRALKRTTVEIAKKVEAFHEAVKWLPGMKQRMDELSDKIYSAEKEKQDLLGRIEKEIANYELEVITKALLKQNKMPKDQIELQQLRQQEQNVAGEEEAKRRKLDEEVREKVAAQARFKDVEFEQKYSEYAAREQAFLSEKRTLLETIASLRSEIESQKKLSSDIAKSASKR
eukprot:TRINITY_DN2480_c4_g1_i1.p1 TRINITY_DN2480_c4_g1~~TRINITY_DN2480_c4_g1_i1.p1  ORF type:complete len:229 (+),score=72.76 TRINITY_DN2480_c4_g1_i1:49-735(+)